MANQKSKYTVHMNIRVSPLAHAWAHSQIPEKYPSYAAYVDFLIRRDKEAGRGVKKYDRNRTTPLGGQ